MNAISQAPARASQPPEANVPAVAPPVDPRKEAVPKDDAVPKYRLLEPAYLFDKHHTTGEQIHWTKPPEHYMYPLNAAARNAVREHKPEWKDPFGTLPVAPT